MNFIDGVHVDSLFVQSMDVIVIQGFIRYRILVC